MNEFALTSPGPAAAGAAAALDLRTAPRTARWALKLLERFPHGALVLTLPDGQHARFGNTPPQADLALANWNVVGAAMKSGDIGFAESFIAGDWTSTDPARVLRYFIRNRAAAEAVIYGTFVGRLAYRLKHLLNRNTRTQAKKNIHAHYDLGNSFYSLWLDPSMTYSAALIGDTAADPHAPLEMAALQSAQYAKYDRVLAELNLAPGGRVLEIGCGWGGFAQVAAGAGHRVTGLTLSPAQLDFAQRRLDRVDLAADLRLQDYRDEHGQYNGVASIEMFEAVGEAYWPSYFATLARTLKRGGRACVQTITIDDALFARYRNSTDFIQQYIFPGGMLPSPSVFEEHAQRAGLRVVNRLAFGRDYARTLASWRREFTASADAVRALGFDERFMRTWHFYLAYCEAAFAEGNTDVFQFTLAHR
jgi:cyclopropane-fatty-acyl-phospholipid synthase